MRNAQSRDRYTKAVKIIPPIKVYNKRQKKADVFNGIFRIHLLTFLSGFICCLMGRVKPFVFELLPAIAHCELRIAHCELLTPSARRRAP